MYPLSGSSPDLSTKYVNIVSFLDFYEILFYPKVVKNIISTLIPAVLEAGRKAREGQSNVSHTYKEDGSVLTRFDTELNEFLCNHISEKFPEANIVSEEKSTTYIPGRDYTFTIDPIDGTDSYSQGLPGWCVAVGLLDADLLPIGGIIYAPRWSSSSSEETLVVAEVGKKPTLNGQQITLDMEYEEAPEQSQLMISSILHKSFSIRKFRGKIRYTGCAVLNLLSIPLYKNITTALLTPLHIWDIAAAHAVLRSLGLTLDYFSGRAVSYADLVNREVTEELIIAGSTKSISMIRNIVTPLDG